MNVEKYIPNTALITATPKAIDFLEKQLENKSGSLIRLSTKLSGCTGFSYVLEVSDGAEEGDEVLTLSDVLSIAVAEKSKDILRHTEIDYVMEGVNGMIRYNNPNVVDQCGCGESFNVG